MANIYSPNESYTGVSASVAFVKGVGETKDKHLIEWFKQHDYKVDETEQNEQVNVDNEKPIDQMTIDELKAYAEGEKINLAGLTKKDDIMARIKAGK